jgi:subtilase family serine protease
MLDVGGQFVICSKERRIMRTMKVVRWVIRIAIAACAVGGFGMSCAFAGGESVPSRVERRVAPDDTVFLPGNTHPMASPELDRGLVEADLALGPLRIVLNRSPEQERGLAAFMERQNDPSSPDYHHWLHADEFGRAYGPNDADIAAVTAWLKSNGLQGIQVAKGRTSIAFSGNAAQVQNAFRVQMHRYLVDGVLHVANDRDPQIPRALAPVVGGVFGLSDFRGSPQLARGQYVKHDLNSGVTVPLAPESSPPEGPASPGLAPELAFSNATGAREDVTPYDFATIYNVLPLWKETKPIIGTGVKIAIAGGSDIDLADVSTFRSAFGLPKNPPTIIHNGADQGVQNDEDENTLDVEMAGAAAPGADVMLVVTGPKAGGYGESAVYIVENEIAPIMNMSYGQCELDLGTSGNLAFNGLFQQGAAEGISIFISSGDQGATACTRANPKATAVDKAGLQVNGYASSPYVTAVGGTDFIWNYITNGESTFWTTNAADGASARGYVPEQAWNNSCSDPLLLANFNTSAGKPFANSEALCNGLARYLNGFYKDLLNVWGGSGGYSHCTATTTGSSGTTCNSGSGYAKPTWQSGTGVPADKKRDVPDLSLFSAAWILGPDLAGLGAPDFGGSAILFCFTGGSGSCGYNPNNPSEIIMQEVGGTSAASPYMAGVMALVIQQTGATQGLANAALYKLAAKDTLSTCNALNVVVGSGCVFHDVTSGSNAMPCEVGTGEPLCVAENKGDSYGLSAGYAATTGYDLTTGLGSINAANLVKDWTSVAPTPKVSITPTTGLAFGASAVGATSAAKLVTVKNVGSVAATLFEYGATIGGTGATSFLKSATTCGATLAVGASCTIGVEFKPAAKGSLTATLSISDNAASATPQTVALSGTGD